VAASADHLKALVRSHVAGDDERFFAVALQVAARAARSGQHRYADELKRLVEGARKEPNASTPTPVALAQPRGDLAELVTVAYPSRKIGDLVLPEDVLERLRKVIHEQRQRHQLEAHGFAPVHRVLLEGPPGTGKTMTASVLAHELGLPLFTIRLDSLLSKFMGETSSKLRVLFDAVASQRAVYLFDEFDAIGGNRLGNDVGEARRILNSFLSFLEDSPPQSLVLASTNHREILDPALFRRFDLVVSYPMPDSAAAVAVLQRRLRGIKGRIRWAGVADEAEGLSPAELVRSAEAAAKEAILSGDPTVNTQRLVAALRERAASRGA
jgi:SpoVK/Ycf46/Vps4 family AAA+-type ATPase